MPVRSRLWVQKRLRAMLGAFFFWRGGHFSCTHKGKPLSFLNPRHFVTALIRGMPPSAYASEGFSPPPEGCLHNLLKIKHASETLCSQSIILGNYISVYTCNLHLYVRPTPPHDWRSPGTKPLSTQICTISLTWHSSVLKGLGINGADIPKRRK